MTGLRPKYLATPSSAWALPIRKKIMDFNKTELAHLLQALAAGSTTVKPRTYSFRAECAFDAIAIRSTLLPWVMNWSEKRENLVHLGEEFGDPNVVVEFDLLEWGPTFSEVLWLIDGIDNCHIAADTLAPTDEFTGERETRSAHQSKAQRPRDEILKSALATVVIRQDVLRTELQRAQYQYRKYAAIGKGSIDCKETDPGWLAIVSQPETGLSRSVSVTSRSLDKKHRANGKSNIGARLSVIQC